MTPGRACVLCGDSIEDAPPDDVHVFSAADVGGDYTVHIECWDREGLADASRHATEATLGYHDAMRRETFAEALDVLLDAMHGKDLNPAWHAALVRVASQFGIAESLGVPKLLVDEDALLKATGAGDGGGDDGE